MPICLYCRLHLRYNKAIHGAYFDWISILMEQANFTLRQLRDLLRHRKYKFAINRVERLLEKEQELGYLCGQFLLALLYYQSSAVNRLLQRNLLKKYKYPPPLVNSLLNLLLRNLALSHSLIAHQLKQNSLFQLPEELPCFPSRDSSLGEHSASGSVRSRNNSLRLAHGEETVKGINRQVRLFIRLLNSSCLHLMEMLAVYRRQVSPSLLQQYVDSLSTMPIKATDGLSQARVKLFYAKLLSVGERQETMRSQEVIEDVTEDLLEVLHGVNLGLAKLEGKAESMRRKYEAMERECLKLLVISMVIGNRTNMKLAEEVATLGISIFKTTLHNLPSRYASFKKTMLPELYLQEQFLKYRIEKQELVGLVALYFPEKALQVEETNREKLAAGNRVIDYYNKRTKIHPAPCSTHTKTAFSEINTVKSIGATFKKKGTISSKPQERSSESKNSLLTRMIVSQIDELNSNFLKFRSLNGKALQAKRPHNKSSFYRIDNSQTLKKQRIGQGRSKQQPQEDTPQARHLRLQQEEGRFRTIVCESKQRFIRRNRQKALHEVQSEQEEVQATKEMAEKVQVGSWRYSSEKSMEGEEKELKRNMLAITARRRTEVLLEILFQNKEALGIWKIAERVETLRKKEQEKAKMQSNRLTSSINRERDRNNIFKFEVIAKEILKRHISFETDRFTPLQKAIRHQTTRKKLIDANFALGNRSIDTLRTKLQTKMNRNEHVADRYHRNEEIFKLKLKKLGTTNFILKKEERERQREDSDGERQREDSDGESREEQAEAEKAQREGDARREIYHRC